MIEVLESLAWSIKVPPKCGQKTQNSHKKTKQLIITFLIIFTNPTMCTLLQSQ